MQIGKLLYTTFNPFVIKMEFISGSQGEFDVIFCLTETWLLESDVDVIAVLLEYYSKPQSLGLEWALVAVKWLSFIINPSS